MHSGAGLEPRKKASASQLTSSGRARPNQRSYYVLPFAWDTELDLHHQSKWEKLVRYHLGQVCLRVLSPLVTVSPGWGAGVILCTPTVLEGKAETPGAPLLSLRFTVNKWPHQGLNAHDPCTLGIFPGRRCFVLNCLPHSFSELMTDTHRKGVCSLGPCGGRLLTAGSISALTYPRPSPMSLLLKITKNNKKQSSAVIGTARVFHFLRLFPDSIDVD